MIAGEPDLFEGLPLPLLRSLPERGLEKAPHFVDGERLMGGQDVLAELRIVEAPVPFDQRWDGDRDPERTDRVPHADEVDRDVAVVARDAQRDLRDVGRHRQTVVHRVGVVPGPVTAHHQTPAPRRRRDRRLAHRRRRCVGSLVLVDGADSRPRRALASRSRSW
jgi:hypothetical protein